MKGLILCGGKGLRLRPFTYTQAKQTLPIANKPIVFYAIESLLEAGICDIGIVVGDHRGNVEATVSNHPCWNRDVHITYLYQERPLGLAHAVKIAQNFIGEERFVVFLGDNILGDSLAALVQHFAEHENFSQCYILLKEMANPCQFGVAELEDVPSSKQLISPGPLIRVRRLLEKPSIPISNLAIVGVYFFDSSIFEAIDAIQPSARGELEITDAIQWLIDCKYETHAKILPGYWIDTGGMEEILDANRHALSLLPSTIDHTAMVSGNSIISGAVTIQAGAFVENSIIQGPAIIGERSVLNNAYIGPFTSIYHDTLIVASEVEHSIVLEHSNIINVAGRIRGSLIGQHTKVRITSKLQL